MNEGQEVKREEVTNLSVKPFRDGSASSHLTFTIRGKEWTWGMPNYDLLTIIENSFKESYDKAGLRKYDSILDYLEGRKNKSQNKVK